MNLTWQKVIFRQSIASSWNYTSFLEKKPSRSPHIVKGLRPEDLVNWRPDNLIDWTSGDSEAVSPAVSHPVPVQLASGVEVPISAEYEDDNKPSKIYNNFCWSFQLEIV